MAQSDSDAQHRDQMAARAVLARVSGEAIVRRSPRTSMHVQGSVQTKLVVADLQLGACNGAGHKAKYRDPAGRKRGAGAFTSRRAALAVAHRAASTTTSTS